MRCALTVAGSDSIGGAGIQADIKAMASLGVHAHTVITAITAQNTQAVTDIMAVPCEMIEAQLKAVLSDSDVRSIKTGMLYDPEIVDLVVELLEDRSVPLVVDPVMVAGVGDSLASGDLSKAIRKKLIPMCDLVTPNKMEAEELTGMKIKNEDDARRACELIGKEGASVYLKGGHMDSNNVIDTFYHAAEFMRFEYPRLERAGHGGGCTLSSYITANLANGKDMMISAIDSRELIQESILSMYQVGKGDKLVDPIVNLRMPEEWLKTKTDLDVAVDFLINMMPIKWIPSVGVNMAYAVPRPRDVNDIAAVDGKILATGNNITRGNIGFGVAEHISYGILAAMRFDPKMRAAINLAYSDNTINIMEEVGLKITHLDREGYPYGRLGDLTSFAIAEHGSVPDVIFDKGTTKKGPMIRMFGKDPNDILDKIEMII